MQGLLDFIKTPEGQGLLAGAFGYAANAQRGAPINSIGRGGLAGLLGYSNALDRQDQQAENQWVQKYRQMQMDKAQYDMDRTKAADAEKSRIESVIRSAISPVSGTQAIGLDAAGPTASKAALIGQMPKLDPNALLAQGVPVERVKELIDAQNFGRQKVARTIKGIGPDGREYEYQVDEFGQRIGDGLAQYRAPIAMDSGGRTALLDPYNFQEKFGVNKTMTPGERDASARGWATVKQGERRLAFDQNKETKPVFNADAGGFVYPPDMRNPNGRVVKVDGAKKPLNESEGKATLYLSQMVDASNTLDALEAKGVKPSPVSVAATNTPYTNWMASSEQQKVAQTQRQWAEAYLRAKTGAAATADEVNNNIRTFFPVVGDSAEVIKQKATARKQAEEAMLAPVGRGADRVPSRNNPPAAALTMPTDINELLRIYAAPR